LGAMPPAVKKMPLMQEVFNESALQFSAFADSRSIAIIDAGVIDFQVIENMAVENTLTNIDEEFATCLADIGNHLNSEDDDEEVRQKCLDALVECYQSIAEEITEHFQFTGKLEELEPEKVTTMMEKLKTWLHISTTRKDTDMDAQKEKEYQDKIGLLETQNKEFAEKQRLANEAKVKADAEIATAKAKVVDDGLRAEVKLFCETNKLNTNKHKEMKIEEILFAAAKAEQTIEFAAKDKDGKDFLEKKSLRDVLQNTLKSFSISGPVVGEIGKFSEPDPSKDGGTIVEAARIYVQKNSKEFSDMSNAQAISVVLQKHLNKQINLSQTNQ